MAVYLDDGTGVLPVTLDGSGNPVVNATLYSLNGVPDTLPASTNSYNAAGQVATTTDQYGRATANLYDVNNNVVQTTNANGTVVRSVLDTMNRVVWQTDPFVPGDATPVLATHTIYNSLGQVTAIERYQGTDIAIGSATYGSVSLPTSTLVSPGTLISTAGSVYNAQGQVAETTNAAGLRAGTVYYPDGEVQYTGPLNADAPVGGPYATSDFVSYTEYLYNQVDGSGQLYNRVIDADSHHNGTDGHYVDTYTDVLGRTVKTVYGDGSFTETLYGVSSQAVPGYEEFTPTPGGSVKVEIAQRKEGDPIVATIYVSDASGNLTDVYEPAVLDSNPASPTYNQTVRPHTSYAYDAEGDEILQVTAEEQAAFQSWVSLGHSPATFTGGTAWSYDQNGNELSRTLPDGESESLTYNIYSQEATHTDFDGNTATYAYLPAADPNAGSLYQVVYVGADSDTAMQTVTYVLDDMGRQHEITDASGTTVDSYDPEGDLIEQDTPEGIIHHAFDPATGELIETWTDYTDVAYGYNTLGELTTTTVNELNGQELATPLVTTDAYDPVGNKTSETLPNGVVTSWTDDDLNRLTHISEMLGTTSLFNQTFTLNDDGTRASSEQTQLQPDGTSVVTDTVWSNDALGRLTSETLTNTGDSSQDYTDTFLYDLVGNRLVSTHTGPGNGPDETITNAYNGDDELTKEVSTLSGETDLAYDANGSLTTSTNGSNVTTYGYDVRNKMVSADVNGVTSTYVYDDAGNRVAETTGGVTTFYLTDDNNPTGYAQPIEQKASATAAPSVTYIIGDHVLAQADASGAVSYLLTDGHGSTRALTDSSGAVTQTFNYTAVGGALGFDPTTVGTVFLFGGDAVYDPASTLYLHGDGTRATDGFFFTQMDSVAGDNVDPLSLHTYLYGGADPVNNFDPSGHDSLGELVGTIGGIAGLIATYSIPVVEAVTPYLTALTFASFAVNPQGAEDFIASGGNPAELVAGLAEVPGLLLDDARSILVFGMGLLQDVKALGITGSEVASLRGAVSNVGGNSFQGDVQMALGQLQENSVEYTVKVGAKSVTVKPDFPVGKLFGVTDCKTNVYLSDSPQIRGFQAVARQENQPLNFVISSDTQSISATVIQRVRSTGGIIAEYDPSTMTFKPITLPATGPWKR